VTEDVEEDVPMTENEIAEENKRVAARSIPKNDEKPKKQVVTGTKQGDITNFFKK